MCNAGEESLLDHSWLLAVRQVPKLCPAVATYHTSVHTPLRGGEDGKAGSWGQAMRELLT